MDQLFIFIIERRKKENKLTSLILSARPIIDDKITSLQS